MISFDILFKITFAFLGLSHAFKGEHLLEASAPTKREKCKDMITRVTEGTEELLLASTALQASATSQRTAEFQLGFLKCRTDMLQAVYHVLLSCNR